MSKRKTRKKSRKKKAFKSQKSKRGNQKPKREGRQPQAGNLAPVPHELVPIAPGKRTQKLSVCMIVKDEERVIRRALESVKDVADEIVVVDTGCTDNTMAIAREFGAVCGYFKWNDCFADARNASMDLATGDWLLILDADEELYAPDRWKLHAIIENPHFDSVALLLRNLFPTPETQTNETLPDIEKYRHTTNHLPRLVRNKPHIRYHRRIHEDFPPESLPPERRYISDISIWHYGYCYQDDRKERRAARNQKLTELYLNENPTDPTSYYYVGSTRLAAGKNEEADEYFIKVLEHAPVENDTYLHFRLMALFHLSRNAALRGDYEAEEKYACEAILIAPEYLDAWLRVGEAFFHQDKFWMAERAFHRYRKLLHDYQKHTPKTRYTLFQLGMEHMACYFLGRCAEFRFDFDRAKEFYQQCIQLDGDRAALAHFYLANIYNRERNFHKMDAHLVKAIQLDADYVKELLQKPVELPAVDKSEIGGSPERNGEDHPDPTAVYAKSLAKPLPLGKSSLAAQKPEAAPAPAPAAPPVERPPLPDASGLPALQWIGPFLESGDWGESSRFLLEAAKAGQMDLYLEFTDGIDPDIPVTTKWANEIDHLRRRILPGSKEYIHLWDVPLDCVPEKDARAAWNIARIDWPTDRLPEGWDAKCKEFDQLWVPSSHHRKILIDAGVQADRICILPGAVDTDLFSPEREVPALPLDIEDRFNFLAAFDWSETRAWQAMLRVFADTFNKQDAAGLILKPDLPTGMTNTQAENEMVEFMKKEGIDPAQCAPIVLLAHKFTTDDMARLYLAADAFLLPGYTGSATPHYLKAMAMGLPVIATRWGAHLDYLDDSNAFLVNVERFEPLSPEIQEMVPSLQGHQWAVPSKKHLGKILRTVYEHPAEARAVGARAREVAVRELDLRTALAHMVQNLKALSHRPNSPSPEPAEKKNEAEGMVKASSQCSQPAVDTTPSPRPAPETILAQDARTFQNCTRVLHIDCGNGDFLKALKTIGVHGIGLTPSQDDLNQCRAQKLEARLGRIHDLRKRSERFDGIYAGHGADALGAAETRRLLQSAFELLKPGGTLLLRVRDQNSEKKDSAPRGAEETRHPADFFVPLLKDLHFEVAYYGVDTADERSLLLIVRRPAPRIIAPKNRMVVQWIGPQFCCHSLALVNRNYSLSLLKRMDLELNLRLLEDILLEGGHHPGQWPELLDRAGRLPSRPVDVTVTHSFPPYFIPPQSGHWVHVLPWEYGSVLEDWFPHLHRSVDEIWVYSNHTKEGIIGDGIDPEKIFVVPLAFDPSIFNSHAAPSRLLEDRTRKSFKFLFCGGTIERKGIDKLVEAYTRAFTRADDVCLVIKDMGTGGIYKGHTFEEEIREIQKDPASPEIVYINDMLPPEEVAGLYRACNALVHPYRGEGFGLPVAEAMACGLPVIVSRGGSCDDFCPPNDTFWIDAPVEYVRIEGYNTVRKSYWLQPSVDSLIEQMQLAASDPDTTAERGERARLHINRVLSWEKTGRLLADRLQSLVQKPILRPMAEPSRVSVPALAAAPRPRRPRRKKRKKRRKATNHR